MIVKLCLEDRIRISSVTYGSALPHSGGAGLRTK